MSANPVTQKDLSLIKDLMLLYLAKDFDAEIAQQVVEGKVPEMGHLSHVASTASRLPNLPAKHAELVKRIQAVTGT